MYYMIAITLPYLISIVMAINTNPITQLITDFRALQAKDAITPESLGYILQRIANLFEQTVDENSFIKSNSYVRNLGLFASVNDALQAAAAREIVDNRSLSILHWCTEGDAGTILMSRWGGNYVTQLLFMHGQTRTSQVRLITAGGNYEVGEWKELVMATEVSYDSKNHKVTYKDIKGVSKDLFSVPLASGDIPGLIQSVSINKQRLPMSGGNVNLQTGNGLQVDAEKKLGLKLGRGLQYSAKGEVEANVTSDDTSELLRRIQGTSEKSSAYSDPFKYVRIDKPESGDIFSEVNRWLDDLHPTDGQTHEEKLAVVGFFRLNVVGLQYEVHNFINSWDGNICRQVMLGLVTIGNNGNIIPSNTYHIVQRLYNGTTWGEWELASGKVSSVSVNGQSLPVTNVGNIDFKLDRKIFSKDAENNITLRNIIDLGILGQTDAEAKAAERGITENSRVRIITWCSGDNGAGDGCSILQSRWGTYYVCQVELFVGQERAVRYRLITTGGNYSVGEWQDLIIPTGMSYDAGLRKVKCNGIRPNSTKDLFTIPMASVSGYGLVKIGKYLKIENGLLTIDVPVLKTALGI